MIGTTNVKETNLEFKTREMVYELDDSVNYIIAEFMKKCGLAGMLEMNSEELEAIKKFMRVYNMTKELLIEQSKQLDKIDKIYDMVEKLSKK